MESRDKNAVLDWRAVAMQDAKMWAESICFGQLAEGSKLLLSPRDAATPRV
jgi:hypothetical protein